MKKQQDVLLYRNRDGAIIAKRREEVGVPSHTKVRSRLSVAIQFHGHEATPLTSVKDSFMETAPYILCIYVFSQTFLK